MPSNSSSDKIQDAESLAQTCAQLEADLAVLRSRYEQYFLGVDRQAPAKEHEAFKRALSKLGGQFTRSTAVRFKIQSLQQKAVTYERLWARIVGEIEAGTYQRDVFKARLHANKRKDEKSQTEANAKAVTPETAAAAGKPAEPSKPAVPAAARPVAATANGGGPALSDAKVRAIYDAYVLAKRKCNEDVSKLSMDALGATLRKQVPELLKKHNAKDVEFKVIIKDGKASLRAFPK